MFNNTQPFHPVIKLMVQNIHINIDNALKLSTHTNGQEKYWILPMVSKAGIYWMLTHWCQIYFNKAGAWLKHIMLSTYTYP